MRSSRSVFTVALLLSTAPCALQAAQPTAAECAGFAKLGGQAAEGLAQRLRRINEYGPPVSRKDWNLKTGEVKVDLGFVRDQVLPEYRRQGITPDRLFLEIDGDSKHLVPVDLKLLDKPGEISTAYQAGHTFRQVDIKLVLQKDGKDIWASEPGMIEDLQFPRVDPASLKDLKPNRASIPAWLSKATGREKSGDFVQWASTFENDIYQAAVNPETKNKLLADRFHDHGSQLKIEWVSNSKTGEREWKVTDLTTGENIPVQDQDLLAVQNAGFNWNIFKWDGDEANGATAYSYPEMGLKWAQMRHAMQKAHGNGIQPRENHASNMLPYQRAEKTKLTPNGPVTTPNGEFVNPPLTGMTFRDVYRFAGAGKVDPAMIARMIEMSRWEREALVRDYGVNGKGGGLLGFNWTNLGSGRDNAPRCLGRPGCLAVDMLTYYKMMIDHEAEFSQYLGKWADADKLRVEGERIKNLLNKEYWNDKLGTYTDLVKRADGTTEHSEINTMVGFWPLMARVPDESRTRRMLAENLNDPKRFGAGSLPPSVSAQHAGQKDADGHPLFGWQGNYWRGGFWPIDGRWMMEGLWNNGLRKESAKLYHRIIGGVAEASHAYNLGDTPYAAVHGHPSDAEKKIIANQPVYWEAYGMVPCKEDPSRLCATWNREIRSDGDLHMTRPNLGWSMALVKRGLKYEHGLEGVPAFQGSEKDSSRWLHALLTDGKYTSLQVRDNPALKPAVDWLRANPKATPGDFQAEFARMASANPALDSELGMLRRGYLEISPTFDPGVNETRTQIRFQGHWAELHISRLDGDRVQVVVKSDAPIPLQFNRNWVGQGARSQTVDAARGSSSIVNVGGKSGRPIRLPDGSDAREIIFDLNGAAVGAGT